MLGPDVGVIEFARLGHRQLEHFLCAPRVRQVGAHHARCPTLGDALFDRLLDLFDVHVQVGQDGRRHALAFPDQAQQNVLRPDVLVPQTRGFLTRQVQDLSDSIREVVAA